MLNLRASEVCLTVFRLKGWLFTQSRIFIGLLLVHCSAHCLCAEIIAESMLVFPAETESIEYDNLAVLRNSPVYNTLRQQFAGTVLQQARLAATKIGIQEEQVDEVVFGSTATRRYGLFGGTFNGSASTKLALRKNISHLRI